MKRTIVRIQRMIEGQLESRLYIEDSKGYIPVFILMEQTESFKFDSKEVVGEVEIPFGRPLEISKNLTSFK